MNTPTKEQIPEIVATLREHVVAVLEHTAVAQVERERADTRHRAILDASVYKAAERWGGDRITDPKSSFLMDDADAKRYFAECDKARDAAGYKDLKPGYCPALIAEHAQSKAEQALIRAAHPYFGVDNHTILCAGMDKRKEYLDLLMGLVCSHPLFRHAA